MIIFYMLNLKPKNLLMYDLKFKNFFIRYFNLKGKKKCRLGLVYFYYDIFFKSLSILYYIIIIFCFLFFIYNVIIFIKFIFMTSWLFDAFKYFVAVIIIIIIASNFLIYIKTSIYKSQKYEHLKKDNYK
jgi:hypothetical protein